MTGGRSLTKVLVLCNRTEVAELFQCRLAHNCSPCKLAAQAPLPYPVGLTVREKATGHQPGSPAPNLDEMIIGFFDRFFLFFK
jgi:hypothetical protein